MVDLRKNLKLEESDIFEKTAVIDGNTTQLNFVNLKPGSVVAVRFSLKNNMKSPIENLQSLVREFHQDKGSRYAELQHMLSKLNLVDFNSLLYCCAEEERDNGGGPYNISGYGDLVYCGLQGVVSILSDIGPNNDLGHPLANNLRMGNWLIGKAEIISLVNRKLSFHINLQITVRSVCRNTRTWNRFPTGWRRILLRLRKSLGT